MNQCAQRDRRAREATVVGPPPGRAFWVAYDGETDGVDRWDISSAVSVDDRLALMSLTFVIVLILAPAWIYAVGTAVAAVRFARRATPSGPEPPPVSLLKPLHGAEPDRKSVV